MKRSTWKKATRALRRIVKRTKKTIRDHFIPHRGNNHVPHVLKHRVLFGYSVILILLKVLVLTVSVTLPAHSLFSSAITPTNIISLTNETRRNLSLPELATDQKLMAAAQAKAEDMFANEYFAHTSPSGVTPWHWFKQFGYNYRSAGENLAAHFAEAEDVTAGWMASPTHRDNIVSDRYSEIGVGVAQGYYDNYYTTFVVQMFGYELNDTLASTESSEPAVEPEPEIIDDQTVETAVPAVSDPVVSEPVTEPNAPATIAIVNTEPQDTVPATPPEVVEPAQNEALTIDLSSLVLRPIENGYAVELSMQNASEAVLYLGTNRATFTPTSNPNIWQTVVHYNPSSINESGERLYVVAGNWDGEQRIENLALIMPNAQTPEIFAFQDAETPKLLGVMDIANIDDAVHRFYILTLLFLGAALLVSIFVKIEIQRPSIIAHAMAVLALAVVLSIV